MKFSFFGSSIVSAFWNGAATYYRGIINALYNNGHSITFFEPNIYGRQQHRDIPDPPYCKIVVYEATEADAARAIQQASDADIVIKTSGVGAMDEWLETKLLQLQSSGIFVAFWDVDAPATLSRVQTDPEDYFRELIPAFDAVFTYGGGAPVQQAYAELGARCCHPIYNALDPETHYPVPGERKYHAHLAFLGNRLPDREARVEEFFLKPATLLPDKIFLIGGSGWEARPLPKNMVNAGHVFTMDHNAFNCSPRAVLNISRDSMARFGFSPATRVFEAAGAAACIITDYWEGIDQFFEPGKEILVARDGNEVVDIMHGLTEEKAHLIGQAAFRRALRSHTYASRIMGFQEILEKELRNKKQPA